MSEQLCANCKWEDGVKYDGEGVSRCSDCGSEIEEYEEESEMIKRLTMESLEERLQDIGESTAESGRKIGDVLVNIEGVNAL